MNAALLAEYLGLADTCARMELTGLEVDRAALDLAERAFAGIEAELAQRIEALAGRSFNINSTKQLGGVLFAELKLPVASHTKTGWSTSTEALQKIEHAHPIVPLVIRWRLLRRLRDSWVIGLRRCIDIDGRVHSRFHVARSFSGHLVNTSPDLARVPGRTPEMEMIRRAFVAPPGCVLMSVDFNQLGLYVLAHLTGDPALVEPLFRGEDMHRLTASAVLDRPVESIGPDDRQLGKIVNFATFAGQGSSALALDLGVSAQEAKEMIARFDHRYARVREFQDEQLRLARERGHIVTIAGRRWPIGGLESLDPHDRSYAERLARRATHEGSVADVARRALLEADRALRGAGLGAVPVHEIVDEVLFQVPRSELETAARIAAQAMRHAYELVVPLVVGVEAGPSWADLEPVQMDPADGRFDREGRRRREILMSWSRSGRELGGRLIRADRARPAPRACRVPLLLVGIAAAATGGCGAGHGSGDDDILPSGPRIGTGPESYERARTRVRDVIQVRSKGHLERHELEAGVAPHRAALGDCYLRRLRDHRFVRGDLVLQAVIESTGQVNEARIIESDVGDWVTERCVIDEVRAMRFDPPRGGKQVVFSLPLHFASDQPSIAIWPGPRTAASAARHTHELDACAGAARVPPPGEVTVTIYVATGGVVRAIGFGSRHPRPMHDAWADCAARTIGRWVFDDPGEEVVKASFGYRSTSSTSIRNRSDGRRDSRRHATANCPQCRLRTGVRSAAHAVGALVKGAQPRSIRESQARSCSSAILAGGAE